MKYVAFGGSVDGGVRSDQFFHSGVFLDCVTGCFDTGLNDLIVNSFTATGAKRFFGVTENWHGLRLY